MAKASKAVVAGRRRDIQNMLRRRGSININDAAAELNVSPMTIRRDLAYLEKKGLLVREYGGAVNAERLVFEFTFARAVRLHREQKERIGRAAAGMVKPAESIILDTGTTTLQVARALKSFEGPLTVYTATLPMISELWGIENLDVVVLGGNVRKASPDLYGPLTEMALERLQADRVFLGAEGIHHEKGLTVSSMEVARMAQIFLRAAKEVVVVADSSKLGVVSKVRYATLDEVGCLVTDKGVSRKEVAKLKAAGIKTVIV